MTRAKTILQIEACGQLLWFLPPGNGLRGRT